MAALCLIAAFLPSFLLVIGTLPFWQMLRRHAATPPRSGCALAGAAIAAA
jgi:chromate transporter